MMQFHWRKLGLIFEPKKITGRPWLTEFAQAPCAIEVDDAIRVYFSCRPAADHEGRYVSYSSFVDLDKDDLTRIIRVAQHPIMALGAKGTFDEFGTYPVSVIQDGDRMLAFYGGWTRCESVPFNVGIGCAVSLDHGISFKRLGPGPIISYSPDEPFILSGPKIRFFEGRWILFYIAGRKWITFNGRPEPVYRIRMATSSNGLNWIKLNRDLVETRIEEDECQASPDVFFDGSLYHMFFCYRRSFDYRGKEGGYRIGYAYSRDLVQWTRDDSKAGINVSESGWDSEMVAYPHLFKWRQKTYMFYLGNQVGRAGFGLAELLD